MALRYTIAPVYVGPTGASDLGAEAPAVRSGPER